MNCTNEYAAIAIPIAASSTPRTFVANAGRMGIKIPNPSRSIKTVKNINDRADLFFNKYLRCKINFLSTKNDSNIQMLNKRFCDLYFGVMSLKSELYLEMISFVSLNASFINLL